MAFIKLNFVNSQPSEELADEIEVYVNTDKLQDFSPVAQFGPNCDAPEGTNTRISLLEGLTSIAVYCRQTSEEILDLISNANQGGYY